MAQTRSLTHSLLDRLLDDSPEVDKEPPQTTSEALRALRAAVLRDLDALLNTRQRCGAYPPALKELDTSLVNYGIPDFTGSDLSSQTSREQFARTVESVIRKYEPRFKTVRVELLDNAEPLDRTLRFRIDAMVYAEPAPEPLVFDSLVEPVTRNVTVKASAHG